MLPEFELLRPASLDEALDLLARYGSDARPLAGGTNVLVELRDHFAGPPILVDIGRLPELRGIALARDGAMVSVGAAVTLAELLKHPLITAHGAPLAQAASVFASPLVRNRATVGGNLVDASPAADTAPPLLALDAQVELASVRGTRCVPLAEFFVGVRKTVRLPDELLIRMMWPAAERRAGAFRKFGLRRADAISVISAAVTVEPNGNGLSHAAVALGRWRHGLSGCRKPSVCCARTPGRRTCLQRPRTWRRSTPLPSTTFAARQHTGATSRR